MCKKLDKYLVSPPKKIIEEYSYINVYEVDIKCGRCHNVHTKHIPHDECDLDIFYCICCGEEKWIPLLDDSYSLSDFSDFFLDKFNLNETMLNNDGLGNYFDASFEAYCKSCHCGGRYRRSGVFSCFHCGASIIDEINSILTVQNEHKFTTKISDVKWLTYYKHPF